MNAVRLIDWYLGLSEAAITWTENPTVRALYQAGWDLVADGDRSSLLGTTRVRSSRGRDIFLAFGLFSEGLLIMVGSSGFDAPHIKSVSAAKKLSTEILEFIQASPDADDDEPFLRKLEQRFRIRLA